MNNLKQRIIALRSQIDTLEAELETTQAEYMAEAIADGVTSETFGGFGFYISANPPRLDLEKSAVPAMFYKPAIDSAAVRKFLMEKGNQPWGALSDEKPYKLIIKKVKPNESNE